MKRRSSSAWLGRNRGGYRHNLDRVRCGRRDTGCDSRRRAGRQRQPNVPVAIQVDETQIKVVASFVGIGKQVYDCNATAPRSPSASRSPGCCRAGFRRRSTARARSGRASTARAWTAQHCRRPCVPPSPDPTKNVPWLKVTGDPVPQHDRCVQQRRVHPAARHARGSGARGSVHRAEDRGRRLHRQLRVLGAEVRKRQHRVAPRLPSETERGPASNQSTPATLQRPCKAGSA